MLGLRTATGSHHERSLHRGGIVGRRTAITVGIPIPSGIVVVEEIARISTPTAEDQTAQVETEIGISGTPSERAVAQIVIVDRHVEVVVRRIGEIEHPVADFPIETVVAARERAVLVEIDLLAPSGSGSVVIRLEEHIRVARIELHALSRQGIDHSIEHAEIALPLTAYGHRTTAVATVGIIGIIILTFVVIRIVHAGREEQSAHEQDGQRPKERVDSFHNRFVAVPRGGRLMQQM